MSDEWRVTSDERDECILQIVISKYIDNIFLPPSLPLSLSLSLALLEVWGGNGPGPPPAHVLDVGPVP